MSESKHTPGYCDWCNGHHETLPLGMCRLHQHAPGLLEACLRVVMYLGATLTPSRDQCRDMLASARAALALAEGKP